MISLVDYIFSNVEYLIGLMTDSKVASAIGANFFYIILSLWVFWLMINFFLLRPMPGGNLVDKTVSEFQHNRNEKARAAEAAKPRIRTRTDYHLNKKTGEWVGTNTSTTTYSDGSSEVYHNV